MASQYEFNYRHRTYHLSQSPARPSRLSRPPLRVARRRMTTAEAESRPRSLRTIPATELVPLPTRVRMVNACDYYCQHCHLHLHWHSCGIWHRAFPRGGAAAAQCAPIATRACRAPERAGHTWPWPWRRRRPVPASPAFVRLFSRRSMLAASPPHESMTRTRVEAATDRAE